VMRYTQAAIWLARSATGSAQKFIGDFDHGVESAAFLRP
jgi:hypothetical protein